MHQTGHNSGVIHAGVYYKPGSLRARLCAHGANQMFSFCADHGVAHRRIGKLIVATHAGEVEALHGLFERGQANGVEGLRLVGQEEIASIEPHCRGVLAIHSPNTGITDYAQVARALAREIERAGGSVLTGTPVVGARLASGAQGIELSSPSLATPLVAERVVTCAGLQADRVARLFGGAAEPSIVPVRGEYRLLSQRAAPLVRGLIYPVPDPAMPFLGVHFTRRIDDTVDVGPNAVFAFARDGYSYARVSPADMWDALSNPRMQRLARRHWRFGLGEYMRSLWPHAQLGVLKRYIDRLDTVDIAQRGTAGVRAQALAEDGALLEDFVLERVEMGSGAVALNVRNAPSPAATSSLAIAEMVVDKLLQNE